MQRTLYILFTLLAVISLVFGGCESTPEPEPAPAPQETPAITSAPELEPEPTPEPAPEPEPTPTASPAKFEVINLGINPVEALAGETANITAVVGNTGGSKGTYAVILTVDGVSVEIKEVAITPGSSKTVTFSLVKDTPGTYEISVGELTSSLTVKEKLVVREVELKYDDGDARDCISSSGHLVDFSPPATPFTIKRIRVVGILSSKLENPEDRNFEIQIWDKDKQILYSANYSYTEFTVDTVSWVEFEVPDIAVSDRFYVHIFTNSPRWGIHIGADDSVVNEHSDVTAKVNEDFVLLAQWPYRGFWAEDESKVNWMIRVIGTAMLQPEE